MSSQTIAPAPPPEAEPAGEKAKPGYLRRAMAQMREQGQTAPTEN